MLDQDTQRPLPTLKKLKDVTDPEVKKKVAYFLAAKDGSFEQLTKAVSDFIGTERQIRYTFGEIKEMSGFLQFIQKVVFCDEQKPGVIWETALQVMGYHSVMFDYYENHPNFELSKKLLSPRYNIFRAYVLFDAFTEWEAQSLGFSENALELLEEACGYGIFHALQKKAQIERVRLDEMSKISIEHAIEIYKFALLFSDLHFAPGCIESAYLLVSLGLAIAEKGEVPAKKSVDKESTDLMSRPITYLKEAHRLLLKARDLESDQHSQKAMKHAYPGRGLAERFERSLKIKSIDEAITMVQGIICEIDPEQKKVFMRPNSNEQSAIVTLATLVISAENKAKSSSETHLETKTESSLSGYQMRSPGISHMFKPPKSSNSQSKTDVTKSAGTNSSTIAPAQNGK